MPNRMVHGEALWGSRTIKALPAKMRAEYAWLLMLALDNGVFEADAKLIWSQCYAFNRAESARANDELRDLVNQEDVARILEELEKAKLLFRWVQCGARALAYRGRGEVPANGRVWGHWVKIDKPGRLPAPSARRRTGPAVPQRLLRKFLGQGPEAQSAQLGLLGGRRIRRSHRPSTA